MNGNLSNLTGYGQCRFCKTEGNHRYLTKEYKSQGVREVYYDLVQECFNINLSTSAKMSSLICRACVERLRESMNFRKMVLASETLLIDVLDENNSIILSMEEPSAEVQVESTSEPPNVLKKESDEEVADGDDDDWPEPATDTNNDDWPEPATDTNNDERERDHDDYDEEGRSIKSEVNADPNLNVIVRVHVKPEYFIGEGDDSRDPPTSIADDPGDPINVNSQETAVGTADVTAKVDGFKDELKSPTREVKPKKYKQYTPEEVQEAAKAVAEKTMTQKAASKAFKVPVKDVAKGLKNYLKNKQEDISDENKTIPDEAMPPSKRSLRKHLPRHKRNQKYPKQSLLKAFDEVCNKRMTQTEAAKFYKVPKSTLFDMIKRNLKPNSVKKKNAKGPQEIEKHTSNILTIMENSNATPIRCHGDGGYLCCFCNKRYLLPGDLKKHTIHGHDRKTKQTISKGKRPSSFFVKLDITHLKCNLCNNNIDTHEKLIEHLIKEHQRHMYTDITNHILPFRFESDDLKCIVCGNVYTKFKLLQEHLNVHYQNYVCEVCNAGFVNQMILYNHSRGHNTGVFTCEVCSKVYSTPRKLYYHKNLVHTRSYLVSKCGYCFEKFKSYHNKLRHLSLVHNIKQTLYSCRTCNRTFRTPGGLRVHKRRDHLMERRYKCVECDMEFFARSRFKAHVLKHSGAKEFQCEVCQKSFNRKFTLVEHMRIHANTQNNCRFKCDKCGAAFVKKCSWRGHMRNKHGIVGSGPPS